jgi:hypothetical protein
MKNWREKQMREIADEIKTRANLTTEKITQLAQISAQIATFNEDTPAEVEQTAYDKNNAILDEIEDAFSNIVDEKMEDFNGNAIEERGERDIMRRALSFLGIDQGSIDVIKDRLANRG